MTSGVLEFLAAKFRTKRAPHHGPLEPWAAEGIGELAWYRALQSRNENFANEWAGNARNAAAGEPFQVVLHENGSIQAKASGKVVLETPLEPGADVTAIVRAAFGSDIVDEEGRKGGLDYWRDRMATRSRQAMEYGQWLAECPAVSPVVFSDASFGHVDVGPDKQKVSLIVTRLVDLAAVFTWRDFYRSGPPEEPRG